MGRFCHQIPPRLHIKSGLTFSSFLPFEATLLSKHTTFLEKVLLETGRVHFFTPFSLTTVIIEHIL